MLNAELLDVKTKEKTFKRIQSEQNILSAAQYLFATKGFEATTSKEIAQRANLAEGLIFKYFKDKKGLLHQIMFTGFNKNLADLAILPHDNNNIEVELTILITWIFDSYYNNLDLYKIAMTTGLKDNLDAEHKAALNNYIEHRRQLIVNQLLVHQQKGHIRKDLDVQYLYEIIQSYAMTKILFLQLEPSQYSSAIKGLLNVLIKGI